jgi:hypothetical protein
MLMRKLFMDMLDSKNIKIVTIIGSYIKNKCTDLAGKDLTDLEKISSLDSEKWSSHGSEVLKILCDSCPDKKRIVIFLDELALMIQTMQEEQPEKSRRTEAHKEVTGFIRWLRFIRQAEFDNKISLVIASSIGLYPLIEQLRLSAEINDIKDFPLKAWEPETAKECILALARGRGIKISYETASQMTEIIGWCSPYYVQAFFDSACDNLFSNERDSYSIEELKKNCFEYLIRGYNIRPTLRHMIERLSKSLSEKEFDLAKKILNKLAHNDGITTKSEIKNMKDQADEDSVRNVLKTLKHDGYIEEIKDGYRFLSKLFRDWWRNEYGD